MAEAIECILEGQYFREYAVLVKDTYGNNNTLAVRARSSVGEPLATLSVNLMDTTLSGPNCTWFKNYSENIGFLESLENQNILKRTGREAVTGRVTVPEVEWLF